MNETDWLFFSLIAPCLAKRSTLVTYAATAATTADPEEEEGATMKRQPVGIYIVVSRESREFLN